ncbi:hypothetical protein COO60DRAFT_1482009 [Scenedesmus sp. NREL 46B-D3]|nr:hypothetical protein COO60DRAFT_1482009 [Scenedesmus sp. NREL 46B-D3]
MGPPPPWLTCLAPLISSSPVQAIASLCYLIFDADGLAPHKAQGRGPTATTGTCCRQACVRYMQQLRAEPPAAALIAACPAVATIAAAHQAVPNKQGSAKGVSHCCHTEPHWPT